MSRHMPLRSTRSHFEAKLAAALLIALAHGCDGCDDGTRSIAPSIAVPPTDQTTFEGVAVSFSVTANGEPPPAYTWQREGDDGVWRDLMDGFAATLVVSTPTVAADDGARFRVVVANTHGSITSETVTLTVLPPPTAPAFVSNPADVGVVAPAPATFSVTVMGTPTPSIRWQTSSDGGTTFADVIGATGATYVIPATSGAMSGMRVRAVAHNDVGSATSSAAVLTVTELPTAPTISEGPQDATVESGSTATFSVEATGVPAPSYQWQRRAPSGGDFMDIVGATSASYTTPATVLFADELVRPDDGAQYRVVVSNTEGSVTSDVAQLSVTPAPLRGFTEIDAGSRQHVLGLREDGTVWSWGSGTNALGRTCGTCPPAPVPGLSGTFVGIHTRSHTSFALRDDGTLWSWGNNPTGELGRNIAAGMSSTSPGQVVRASDGMPLTGIVGVTMSGSGGTVLAWTDEGVVWTWGSAWNVPGASYTSTVRLAAVPHPHFDGSTPARSLVRLVAGGYGFLGVDGEGTAVYWGDAGGSGTLTNVTPLSSLGVSGPVVDVALSETGYTPRIAVVTEDGSLYHQPFTMFSADDPGGVSNAMLVEQTLPEPIVRVATMHEQYVVVAIGESGAVYTVGRDVEGMLGDGMVGGGMRTTYDDVDGIDDAVAATVAREGVLTLRADGTLYAWGDNYYAILGTTVHGLRGDQIGYVRVVGSPYVVTGR